MINLRIIMIFYESNNIVIIMTIVNNCVNFKHFFSIHEDEMVAVIIMYIYILCKYKPRTKVH